jgi:O-6-methylguanine DNA methyltransferase
MTDRITSDLSGLKIAAPPGLQDAVLATIGVRNGFTTVAGPIGPLFVAWSPDGITAIAPTSDGNADFVTDYETRTGIDLVYMDTLPDRWESRLMAALETGRIGKLPVDLSALTPFQQDVLHKTAEIPPGELRPYGWVAREIGKPGATRAVGSALNRNPVPVVIPCHRVGRSDGTIGNYAYGPEMKRDLLAGEGLDPDAADALADRGVRLTGSDTTNIFCFPTCRHARRTMPRHEVEFHDAQEARGAGYRPCKVCRPAAAAA